MQLALNILDLPCYHGLNLVSNIRDTEMWNEALDAKFFGKGRLFSKTDWDQLLGHHSAIADLPAILFAEDLLKCYPECKVVLVKRDIDQWYRSFDEGVISNIWNPVIRTIARLDSRFVGKLGSTSARWTEGWMGAHSREEMRAKAKEKYREHYAMVERITPPENLLRFQLSDGWAPLCSFLDKPIPDVAFPRVNESAALSEKIGLIARRGVKNATRSLIKILSPIVVIAVAWWVFRTGL